MTSLADLLKIHEGFESHAYKCTANKTTIGIGRNIDPTGGIGITEAEALYLLNNDIDRCRLELEIAFDFFKDLDPVRSDACINMVFNLGLPVFKTFTNTLKYLSEGKWDKAADAALDSKWAQQVGLRAFQVSEMIRTGKYPS